MSNYQHPQRPQYSHYPNQPRPGFTSSPYAGRPGGGLQPVSQRQMGKSRREKRATGFRFALGYLAVIWVVFIVNAVFLGGWLTFFGIHPLDASALPNIFTAPLLHADLNHIMANSIPGAIFCFLIGYSGARVFWEVTAFSVLASGIGIWLFGGVGTNHIGASGLVYGWLAYLVIRGIFNRSGRQIVLGVILGFLYSELIWGVLPLTPGVSWQGHLFGAIGGILAGMIITSDDPPELVARRAQLRAQRPPTQVPPRF
ncbi:rhomboid family intramembrane serine protease [Corynebacterium sp. LK2510]|uniref:rhomboid family intramembrane serine protease n=1 Tax=Corynebacterium sp. LK2510 TaxID=3110472 RepID=UPI00390817AC